MLLLLFVLNETEKVSNKFDVLACFTTKNDPGDSIDCQLQLSLQYKKNSKIQKKKNTDLGLYSLQTFLFLF